MTLSGIFRAIFDITTVSNSDRPNATGHKRGQ